MSQKTAGFFQRVLARPAPAEVDAADLGTCFGLECSLAADSGLPDEGEEPGAQPGWIKRLTSFGRS